jgi:hypothetical protein
MTSPAFTPSAPSSGRLVSAALVALGASGLILVTAVLPAEYGIDPLGTGAATGLLQPNEPTAAGTVQPAPTGGRPTPTPVGGIAYFNKPFATDQTTFTIGPYDYVEYKYRLEQGASVVFSWTASATVGHELHADRDGADGHNPVSFDKRELAQGSGMHTAPFAGMHGWFWENLGGTPVTVTMSSAGFYSTAMEYRPNRRQIPHPVNQNTLTAGATDGAAR